MMKMRILFSVLFLLCLMLGMSACDGGTKSGETTAGQPDTSSDTTYRLDWEKYTILYSKDANEYEKDAAKAIRAAWKEALGTAPNMSADNKVTAAEGAYEILVGDTNRSESAEAISGVTGTRFVIKQYGNRIVIQASNDTLLEKAVEYFLTEIVPADLSVSERSEPLNYISDEYPHQCIVEGSKGSYEVLYSRSLTSAVMQNVARQVANQITDLTDVRVSVDSAGYASVDASQKVILVGKVSGSERSVALYDSLAPNEYGIFTEGNQIYLLGKSDLMLKLAVEEFCNRMKYSLEKGENNTWNISILNGDPIRKTYEGYFVDYPLYPSGTQVFLDCANATLEYKIIGTTLAAYTDYRSTLEQAGFTLCQESTAGANRFATYANAKGALVVNYTDYDRAVRIISTPLENAYLPKADLSASTEKITQSALTVLALNYEYQWNTGAVEIGNNGLAFVYTLEDGSFLIYDGGCSVDAEALYQWLSENNQRQDGIVVAAWVITHSHNDHYGAFKKLATTHAKDITVESVIINPPSAYMWATEADDTFLLKDLESCVEKFNGDCTVIYGHTGQKIQVRNAVVEILLTCEDLYPFRPEYGNETSMVTRVHIGGKTVIMFGDAENDPIPYLVSVYGSALKSDYIQVPHHGNSGGTVDLYNAVDADIAIFPTSAESFEKYTAKAWNMGANWHLVNEVAGESYSAGTTVTFSFGA